MSFLNHSDLAIRLMTIGSQITKYGNEITDIGLAILNNNSNDGSDKDSAKHTKKTKNCKTKMVVFSAKTKKAEIKTSTSMENNMAICSIFKISESSTFKDKQETKESLTIDSNEFNDKLFNASDLEIK